MRTRILDLDESVVRQELLMRRSQATVLHLQDWGPSLRMGCSHGSFQRFQDRLRQLAGSTCDTVPILNFLGSGDFHHVSLALLRRQLEPCNLLVLDKHPDWMYGIPLMHCGTWLYHAAQLPQIKRIFHIGGDLDFDNAYRWLAPWSMLESGKIVVVPARRRFQSREWAGVPHDPLRRRADEPAGREVIEDMLHPFRAELAARPLYISLDKDVLTASEAAVNWDSGYLTAREAIDVLRAFLSAAESGLAGMDVVGDWSPVRLKGLMRRVLHWTEHPHLVMDADEATRRNEPLNALLYDLLRADGDRGCREDFVHSGQAERLCGLIAPNSPRVGWIR